VARRGEKEGERGSGGGLAVVVLPPRERSGWEEDEADSRARPVSGRERGRWGWGRVGWLGLSSRREKGARGLGLAGRKKKREGRKKSFANFFFKPNFQYIFQLNF